MLLHSGQLLHCCAFSRDFSVRYGGMRQVLSARRKRSIENGELKLIFGFYLSDAMADFSDAMAKYAFRGVAIGAECDINFI